MHQFTPTNILVTGGAGFIGSHFILHWLEKYPNTKLINVDKLTYAAAPENLANAKSYLERYQFEQADIVDQNRMESLLRQHSINCIVHFAAESHVDRSIAEPKVFLQTNVLGTFSLLAAAKKVWLDENHLTSTQCRFHHISTDEVYGTLNKDDPAFCETTAYAPNSPYSASKASSDHLVRAYHHTYRLPITMSNCSNNYGPHQHEEKLIPTVIKSALTSKPIPIYGNGSNIRDWLYVKDHCEALDKILHDAQTGSNYNIGGNTERNNLELAQQICITLAKVLDVSQDKLLNLITFVTDRAGHDWRYAINPNKIQQELNWQPRFNLTKGLMETIHWYLQKWRVNACV